MKPKTLKLIAILLIFAGAFTACNGKEYPFLSIDTTTITATAEGGVFYIAVISSGSWTTIVKDAENHSWLTLTNTSGVNDGVITVNITENLYFAARSATIKISTGDLSEYVTVNQTSRDFPVGYDCNNELFFYNFQGEKSFFYDLLLNDWLLVAFYPETQDEEILDFISQFGIFKNTSEISHSDEFHHLLFVQTMTQKKCSQLKEIIRVLKKHAIVAYANLAFYFRFCHGFRCTDIGSFSHFFYVEVIDSNNLSDLHTVMQRTNTWIFEQDRFMPNWFILGTDKNSQGNALQMAQYFFETGKFSTAEPDVIFATIGRHLFNSLEIDEIFARKRLLEMKSSIINYPLSQ